MHKKLEEQQPAEEKPVAEQPAESPAKQPAAETAGEPATPAAGTSEEKPVEQASRDECKRFVTAFGAQGGVWYAEGKSFDEATQLHIAGLKAENDALKQRLQGANRGETTPLSSGPGGGEEERDDLVPKLGANLAKVARGMKLAATSSN